MYARSLSPGHAVSDGEESNSAFDSLKECDRAHALARRDHHYVERLTAEGLSKKEIIRCLKRYVLRELYSPCPPHNERQFSN